MTDPILPTAAPIVTALIDGMVAARPSVLGPMNRGGKYTAIPTMARAQVELALSRVADEVRSARLRLGNSGDSLRALCASEFNTTLPPDPQTSLATIQLARWASPTGALPAGVIRKGQQFTKRADPNAHPLPIASATYESLQTVYVPSGQTFATVTATAVASGVAANAPNFGSPLGTFAAFAQAPAGTITSASLATGGFGQLTVGAFIVVQGPAFFSIYKIVTIGDTALALLNVAVAGWTIIGTVPAGCTFALANVSIQPSSGLFDSFLQVVSCEASGGSSGLTDPTLIAAARAYAIGQYGPTDGALVAGVLRQQAARHYAFFRAGALPYAQGYVADETWSSGSYWTSLVAQSIATDWAGFGCRTRFGLIVNQAIQLSAVIQLTTTEALSNTDAIDTNVRAAARAYFDDRPDWYSWRTSALRGALSKADPNIQACISVAVIDSASGATLTPPVNTFGTIWAPTLTHLYIGASANNSDNVLSVTYLPPS